MKKELLISNPYLKTIGLFLLLIYFAGCSEKLEGPETGITAIPVVKITSTNYTAATFAATFPDTTTLNSITQAYTNNYSEAIRLQLIGLMKSKVAKLGEDVNLFDSVIANTGCNQSDKFVLPTYAERAKYEGNDVWILQLTYGINAPNFGHYKCFALDIEHLDTLVYLACR